MIIGNNKNNSFNMNNNFQNRINQNTTNKTEENKKDQNQINNMFTKDIFSYGTSNTKNKEDMYDRSLALLNDRLQKGTITLEEFNKKCREISNKRNKN